MHRAPAVNFTVLRSRWQLRCIGLLSLLALLVFWSFVQAQAEPDLRSVVIAGTLVASCLAAVNGWRKSPQGVLHWDGQQWFWSGFNADPSCRVSMAMDFQSVLLVSLRAQRNAPVWLWLQAQPGDFNWRALRRAIVSGQGDCGAQPQGAESSFPGAGV